VSAKGKFNVSESIIEIAKNLMTKEPKQQSSQKTNMGLNDTHKRPESNKCCAK
jgi:hypothetical protein